MPIVHAHPTSNTVQCSWVTIVWHYKGALKVLGQARWSRLLRNTVYRNTTIVYPPPLAGLVFCYFPFLCIAIFLMWLTLKNGKCLIIASPNSGGTAMCSPNGDVVCVAPNNCVAHQQPFAAPSNSYVFSPNNYLLPPTTMCYPQQLCIYVLPPTALCCPPTALCCPPNSYVLPPTAMCSPNSYMLHPQLPCVALPPSDVRIR